MVLSCTLTPPCTLWPFLPPGGTVVGANGSGFRGTNMSLGYGDDSAVGMGGMGGRRPSSASSAGARSPTMTSSSSRDFLSNVSSELNDFAQQTTSLFSDIFGKYGAYLLVSSFLGCCQVVRVVMREFIYYNLLFFNENHLRFLYIQKIR